MGKLIGIARQWAFYRMVLNTLWRFDLGQKAFCPRSDCGYLGIWVIIEGSLAKRIARGGKGA
eukprot:COSAG02_NODE_6681_length_3421_cov_52.109573_2_plen_62_part_00